MVYSQGTIVQSSRRKIGYIDADTDRGSSGSGIFDRQGRMIGIHVAGGCYQQGGQNFGVRLDMIMKRSDIL